MIKTSYSLNFHLPFKLRTKGNILYGNLLREIQSTLDGCMWGGDDGTFQYSPSGMMESSNIYPSRMTENMLSVFRYPGCLNLHWM